MKKLLSMLAVATIIASCTETSSTTEAGNDSLRAVATGDSLAAIKASPDTANKLTDSPGVKTDTAKKNLPE